MRVRIGIGVLAATLAAAGCGLKGPLYLPEKPGPVTTRPGPAAPPSAPTPAPATPTDTPPPLPPAAGDKTGG